MRERCARAIHTHTCRRARDCILRKHTNVFHRSEARVHFVFFFRFFGLSLCSHFTRHREHLYFILHDTQMSMFSIVNPSFSISALRSLSLSLSPFFSILFCIQDQCFVMLFSSALAKCLRTFRSTCKHMRLRRYSHAHLEHDNENYNVSDKSRLCVYSYAHVELDAGTQKKSYFNIENESSLLLKRTKPQQTILSP